VLKKSLRHPEMIVGEVLSLVFEAEKWVLGTTIAGIGGLLRVF